MREIAVGEEKKFDGFVRERLAGQIFRRRVEPCGLNQLAE